VQQLLHGIKTPCSPVQCMCIPDMGDVDALEEFESLQAIFTEDCDVDHEARTCKVKHDGIHLCLPKPAVLFQATCFWVLFLICQSYSASCTAGLLTQQDFLTYDSATGIAA